MGWNGKPPHGLGIFISPMGSALIVGQSLRAKKRNIVLRNAKPQGKHGEAE
jgi:hypothetical protein